MTDGAQARLLLSAQRVAEQIRTASVQRVAIAGSVLIAMHASDGGCSHGSAMVTRRPNPRRWGHYRMSTGRLILVVLEVENLDGSLRFYRDQLGIPLKIENHRGTDRWISGDHAALSWHDGAFLHFALYKSKGAVTRNVQVGFPTKDLEEAHRRLVALGVNVEHGPRDEPWGKTARYTDPDGNSVSLTETSR